LIEVFIHSSSEYVDLGHYREMAVHPYCSPDMASVLEGELAALLKGRIISQEDLTVLRKVGEVSKSAREEIKVYDVSRAADKFKALAKGVRKTPTIVINGEKHEGMEKSLKAVLTTYGL